MEVVRFVNMTSNLSCVGLAYHADTLLSRSNDGWVEIKAAGWRVIFPREYKSCAVLVAISFACSLVKHLTQVVLAG
jgi:hypothetical protein